MPSRGPHPLLGRGLKHGVSCPKIDEKCHPKIRFSNTTLFLLVVYFLLKFFIMVYYFVVVKF